MDVEPRRLPPPERPRGRPNGPRRTVANLVPSRATSARDGQSDRLAEERRLRTTSANGATCRRGRRRLIPRGGPRWLRGLRRIAKEVSAYSQYRETRTQWGT